MQSSASASARVSSFVVASVLAALTIWAVDVAGWPSVRRPLPIALSFALAVANGAAMSVVFAPAILLAKRVRPPSWRLGTVVLVLCAGVLLALDRAHALPDRMFSVNEGVAHLVLALAWMRLLRFRPAFSAAAVAAGLWVVLLLAFPSVRRSIERHLPGVWDEAFYARRWLRRARQAEPETAVRAELARLTSKYAIVAPDAVADAWDAPPPAPAFALSSPKNVVVFFVDTLRADVAADPSIMPETVAWASTGTRFTRTYASGSSTLLTLVPMLGCRYDASPNEPPRLLTAARRLGMTTSLAIPREAYDYHRATYPKFRFDRELVVEGHVPVASDVVDRALGFLRNERPERFLLWIYQHDVHGWGDFAGPVVERHANEAQFQNSTGVHVHWHYRAAAREVDQAFARLRRGLEESGLAKDTVVIFVSDHGEALGQGSEPEFWMHSTYLWEPLIRVPFVIAAPGEAPRTIDDPVSTIDLLPTLARFLSPDAARECHGEDGLEATERRFPILFSAMEDGRLTRVGMLSGAERKLVVDLQLADARLFRIGNGAEEDVTSEYGDELSLRLEQIVRAPIFGPRD